MPLLSDSEVTQKLEGSEWELVGDEITRQFEFEDFVGSIRFVNAVAEVAESANHHPDILVSWNKVTLTLSTHSEGGLTGADFQLAARVDELA